MFANRFSLMLTYRINFLGHNLKLGNMRLQHSKTKENNEFGKSVSSESIEIENTENNDEPVKLDEEEDDVILSQKRSVIDNDSLWEYNSNEDSRYQKVQRFLTRSEGIPIDFAIWLQHKYDFSYQGFKRMYKRYFEDREKVTQRYMPSRHGILGPDLATAHFITYRGGKVRFEHLEDNWITHCQLLPNRYNKQFVLTAIDATGCKLRYIGLDNLVALPRLQELNLNGNKHFDDWCCDKLSRIYRNSTSLATLDLTNTGVTNRGIETLHRIKSLRKLIIKGTKAANHPFLELLIILFNDVNPECEIIS